MYDVAFVSAEKREQWRSERWFCKFVIVDGAFQGRPLLHFINVIPKGRRPTPGFMMSKAWAIGTDRRPPKNLARYKPEQFLGSCVFRAKVGLVTKSHDGGKLPESLRYSKVESLRARIAGSPPVAQRYPRVVQGTDPPGE